MTAPQVHLVEGGEHGGGLLGLDQALGDPGAQPGHGHALLGAARLAAQARLLGRRRGRPRPRDRPAGRPARARPGRRPRRALWMRPSRPLPGIWPGSRSSSLTRRRAAGARTASAWPGALRRRRRLGGGLLGLAAGAAAWTAPGASDDRQHRVGGDHGADLGADLPQHAVRLGRDLQDDLVGLQVDQGLALPDAVAGLLVPGQHGGVGDGLREGGDSDFAAHRGILRFIFGLMRPVRASSIRRSCCSTWAAW